MKLSTILLITNTLTWTIIFLSCCALLEIKYDWSRLTAAESNWLVRINSEAFWVVSITGLSFICIVGGPMIYAFHYGFMSKDPQQKKR